MGEPCTGFFSFFTSETEGVPMNLCRYGFAETLLFIMEEINTMEAKYFAETFMSDDIITKRVNVVLINGYRGLRSGKYERVLAVSPDYAQITPLQVSMSNVNVAFSMNGNDFRVFFGTS